MRPIARCRRALPILHRTRVAFATTSFTVLRQMVEVRQEVLDDTSVLIHVIDLFHG